MVSHMVLDVQPSGQACGATVRCIDLRDVWTDARIDEVQTAWATHKVLAFPDQQLAFADLERLCIVEVRRQRLLHRITIAERAAAA